MTCTAGRINKLFFADWAEYMTAYWTKMEHAWYIPSPPPHTHTHTNASVSIISCAIGLRMLSYIYFQVDHLPDLIPCSCFQPNSHHPWLNKGTLHLLPLVGKQDTNAKTINIMHWDHRLSPLYWGERTCWCLWVMRAASTPALLYIHLSILPDCRVYSYSYSLSQGRASWLRKLYLSTVTVVHLLTLLCTPTGLPGHIGRSCKSGFEGLSNGFAIIYTYRTKVHSFYTMSCICTQLISVSLLSVSNEKKLSTAFPHIKLTIWMHSFEPLLSIYSCSCCDFCMKVK